MPYVFLGLAIAAEVVGTSLLKSTQGFTRLWPTVGCLAGYVVAFVLLAHVIKHVPVGIAYATWSGVGTVAIALIGLTVLGQPLTVVSSIGLAMVVVGVVAVNLGGAH